MSNTVLYTDQTDPDMRLAWPGDTGLRNFTGWTMAVEVVSRRTGLIEMTKTSGVVGGDGTGSHNVNIAWTAAELDDLAGYFWNLRPTATNGAERAVFTMNDRASLPILEVRAAPAEPPP